ncbi:hypothetical protein FHX37_1507 [Haloactinospora alba]|uniref:Uncharacterized protein n=1 Tax=Haloactinospora alba TaxID=405555 RepID=A0A543NID3_9ACTN|nr:hypothetical protein FHX37_1507 [Haloactinospora alba]
MTLHGVFPSARVEGSVDVIPTESSAAFTRIVIHAAAKP